MNGPEVGLLVVVVVAAAWFLVLAAGVSRDRRRRLERLAADLGLRVLPRESTRSLERRVAERARIRWGGILR